MAAATQLRLKFPDLTLVDDIDITDAAFQELVAEAVSQCPVLHPLTENQQRFAVIYALSDRRKIQMATIAEMIGETSERTLFRWKHQPWLTEAVIQIIETMTPDYLKLLSAALNEEAGSLAMKLRFGDKSISNLSPGELKLVEMLTGTRQGVTLRMTSSDGQLEAEFTDCDILEKSLKENRLKRIGTVRGGDGRAAGGAEHELCRSLPLGETVGQAEAADEDQASGKSGEDQA